MRRPEFTLTIDLHGGRGAATILTTDLSADYVRINAGCRRHGMPCLYSADLMTGAFSLVLLSADVV